MRSKVLAVTSAMAFVCALGTHDRLAAQQRFAPTSVIDPATGEPVAINYRSEGRVIVVPPPGKIKATTSALSEELPDWPIEPTECDPIYDYGCQPCPTNNPAAWCYQPPCTPAISNYVEFRAGNEPNGPLDVLGMATSNCGYLVVTGIGGRIDGHDNYTTLHLRARRIYPNGTWGETVTYRFGTEPNHSLEAWGEVPAGYAITGLTVGQSQSENLVKLEIYYRKLELTSAGLRLTGPTQGYNFGNASYPWYDATYNPVLDASVLVGVGLRAVDGERTATMALYYGLLPGPPSSWP
jgi:hypothetical protein